MTRPSRHVYALLSFGYACTMAIRASCFVLFWYALFCAIWVCSVLCCLGMLWLLGYARVCSGLGLIFASWLVTDLYITGYQPIPTIASYLSMFGYVLAIRGCGPVWPGQLFCVCPGPPGVWCMFWVAGCLGVLAAGYSQLVILANLFSFLNCSLNPIVLG